jgi:trk system potassium uptake protein
MINFRIIARVFGLLLIFEGLFMLVSAAVSLLYKEAAASSFFYSALITVITGIIVFSPLRNEEKIYGNKEGYIIVTGIWLLFSLFGTLPFLLSGSIKSFTDAFFESMSGFTTTGATIIRDVESLPNGILFWRSLTQWIGGIGIIFISLSILPIVKSVNIQISVTDFTGQVTDKIHPRIKDAAKRLIIIYVILTFSEALFLLIGGMPAFDAICHSFSTISTGGFSTRNGGISAFTSPYIKVVITIFMFIAGTNLSIIYFGLKRNFKKIIENNEFAFYSVICIVSIVIVTPILYFYSGDSFGKSLLDSSFHVISLITTTGYYTENYNLWGNLLIIILFFLMFTGGTSGSSSGSVKIVRLLIITKNNRQEMKRLIHPDAFIPVRLDQRIVPQSTVYNLLVFITLYFLVICVSAFIISIMGYDIITSFSTAAAILGNVGPGLGTFGPFTNYSIIPAAGKWFFSVLMLLGRLELITVIILFTRNFYRR